MKRVCLCLSLLSSLAVATNGWACGDKLVQVGRGVRYQRANAVRPATIVMFVSPSFDRRVANHLRSQLTLVGHKVQIVDDRAAFASALMSKRSDIVLTDVENLAAVTEQVNSTPSKPTIIPLIERSATVAAEIQARFPFVMLLSSREFDQVALISRAMK